MKDNELKNRINSAPLLNRPREERLGCQQERMELIQLLMLYKKAESTIQEQLNKPDTLAEAERAAHRAFTTKRYYFDGVALMEAANDAIRGFEAGHGAQFLTYFELLYEQRAKKEARAVVDSAGSGSGYTRVSKEEARILKQLRKLLERTAYTPESMPRSLYEPYAQYLGMSSQKLEQLLCALVAAHSTSMDVPIGGESESTLGQTIADPEGETAQAQMEQENLISWAINHFADADEREYPRLFLTNDLLYPLKADELDEIKKARYGKLLQKNEPTLWQNILVLSYLCFLYQVPPTPDSIVKIILGRLERPLQDKSIAEYKGVSAAAISKNRKRYASMQQNYRKVAECL